MQIIIILNYKWNWLLCSHFSVPFLPPPSRSMTRRSLRLPRPGKRMGSSLPRLLKPSEIRSSRSWSLTCSRLSRPCKKWRRSRKRMGCQLYNKLPVSVWRLSRKHTPISTVAKTHTRKVSPRKQILLHDRLDAINGQPFIIRYKLSASNILMQSANTIKLKKAKNKLLEERTSTTFTGSWISARIKSMLPTFQSTTEHALSQIDSLRVRKGWWPEETASWCANAKASWASQTRSQSPASLTIQANTHAVNSELHIA